MLVSECVRFKNFHELIVGLESLHVITKSHTYQLRVDLEDWYGNTAYAMYKYD